MPKKKKTNEKLLAFSSPTLTPSQDKFIRKHMKGGRIFDKKQALRSELETLHGSVVQKLEQVETGVTELSRLVTNKEQAEMVTTLKMQRGAIVGGIGTSAKTVQGAVDKLKTADAALDDLTKTLGETRSKFTTLDGTEIDDREAIRKLRVAAEGKLRGFHDSWMVGYGHVSAEMNKVSPNTIPNIPPEADLRPKFRENIAALPATPKDMGAGIEQAQTEFDALVAKMKTEHDAARVALDRYAAETLETDLKIVRLFDVLDGTMAQYDEMAESLTLWGVDGHKALADRAKPLRTRIDDLGDGKVPLDKIVETFDTLRPEVVTLVKDARTLLSAAHGAFSAEQSALEEQLAKLKSRLDALDKKTLPPEQRGPIKAFLSATDASITKLGGANTAALKAARQMLSEGERMVAQAENITSINAEIASNAEIAWAMLKPLLDGKAPVAELAAEQEAVLKAFEAEWLKKAPDAALKTSGELKAQAEALKVQNALLVQNRAAAAAEIEKLETKYAEFNALFKELLENRNAPKVRDYRGPVRGEIDGVKTWNATKMDPAFHPTVTARIATLSGDLDARMTEMRAALASSDEELAERVKAAKDLLDKAKADGSSEAEIAALQEAYDQALGAQTVYNAVSKDLLNAEAHEQRHVENRETFLAEAEAWIKETKKAKGDAKEGDPFERYADEVDRQIVRLEATVKAAKADKTGPTGTQGLAELREVKAAVLRIEDRGAITPPDKLGDIAGNWSDAVSDFLDKSGQIVTAVAAFEKQAGTGDKASRAIEGVLFDVYGRIAPTRFAEAGRVLSAAPAESAQKRKAARELALSEVRRIKKALMDDAVVKACLANPFGIGGLTTKTIARLEQIELDVLRAA